MADKSFADMGRIKALKSLYEGTPFKAFPEMKSPLKGQCSTVLRTVLMEEGTDFNLEYFPLQHLGYKATVAVVGEIYAQFARPQFLSVTLGVSSKLDYPQVQKIWSGIVAAASEHKFGEVALDLVPSKNGLTISVSATGTVAKEVEDLRQKPESKDVLCISGSLGGAFFGMQVLNRELLKFSKEGVQPDLEKNKMMVGYYLKPEIEPSILPQMEKEKLIPTCGVLVSKGLADAVKKISAKTSLGVKVYSSMIPFSGNTFSLGKEFGIDTVEAALNGGDDYRLLFVLPIEKAEAMRHEMPAFEVIGHLAQADVECVMVMPEGAELPITAVGWKEGEK